MLVSFNKISSSSNFGSSGKYAFLQRPCERPGEAIAALWDEYNALPDKDKLSTKALVILGRIKQLKQIGLTPKEVERMEMESVLRKIATLVQDEFGYVPKQLGLTPPKNVFEKA